MMSLFIKIFSSLFILLITLNAQSGISPLSSLAEDQIYTDYIECKQINTSKTGQMSKLLMSRSEWCLANAINEMNKRQAAVSYNIANASTPGFKPIRFPDEIKNAINLYGDASMLNQVHLDDEMVKATHLRLKHSAYIRLLTTKMQITRKVVTLNKGG